MMAYLEAESENRQLKVFPQNDFGYVPKRFLLSARSNSITEHFVSWKLGALLVFVVIQRMFLSWVHELDDFYSGISDVFIFIH